MTIAINTGNAAGIAAVIAAAGRYTAEERQFIAAAIAPGASGPDTLAIVRELLAGNHDETDALAALRVILGAAP